MPRQDSTNVIPACEDTAARDLRKAKLVRDLKSGFGFEGLGSRGVGFTGLGFRGLGFSV